MGILLAAALLATFFNVTESGKQVVEYNFDQSKKEWLYSPPVTPMAPPPVLSVPKVGKTAGQC